MNDVMIDAFDEGMRRYTETLERFLADGGVTSENVEEFVLESHQTVEPLTTRYVLKHRDKPVSSLLISYTLGDDDV